MLIFVFNEIGVEGEGGFSKVVFLTKTSKKWKLFFFGSESDFLATKKDDAHFLKNGTIFGVGGGRGRRYENCLEKTKNEYYLFCTHSLIWNDT